MYEDAAKAFNLGLGMGQAFDAYGQRQHEAAVQGKMDEIIRAAGERGGDITMVDPNMFSDRVGLEAMGRVTAQYAKTAEGQTAIMRNNALQARQRYSMFQQYMKDIDDAIKQGDQMRTVGLMSNMVSQSGVPYRFTPTEDGQIRVGFVNADGVHDKGTMGMKEVYDLIKPYVTNEGRFIRDSVMYGMAVQEDNMGRMMNPGSWRTVTDARGNQYSLIPQTILRNGQYEPGFLVAGPGGQRNMTMDEVAQSGMLGGNAGAGGGLTPEAVKVIEKFSTVIDPNSGQKVPDAHMAEALSVLTKMNGGDPNRAVIALQDQVLPWVQGQLFDKDGEPLPEAADVAELWANMTPGQRALHAVTMMMAARNQQPTGKDGGRGLKPEKQGSNPENDARWARALGGKGKYQVNLEEPDEEYGE